MGIGVRSRACKPQILNIYGCYARDLITPLFFVSFVSVLSSLTALAHSTERIYGVTYHIPFSPDYSDGIHTKYTLILPEGI